jgi:hypothetical protein
MLSWGSYHSLGGESLDLLNGARSSLLEGDTVQLQQTLASIFPDEQHRCLVDSSSTYPLVHVNGVLAGDDIRDGGALGLAGRLLSLGRHF